MYPPKVRYRSFKTIVQARISTTGTFRKCSRSFSMVLYMYGSFMVLTSIAQHAVSLATSFYGPPLRPPPGSAFDNRCTALAQDCRNCLIGSKFIISIITAPVDQKCDAQHRVACPFVLYGPFFSFKYVFRSPQS